jgi:NTP pyrophosphatase (non-canonical NTP hydrolase)
MKEIIELNYQSTVQRGLITPSTTFQQFLDKILEEVNEFEKAHYTFIDKDRAEELADIVLVCLNFAKHFGIDIEQELKNKIQKNFERAK